MEEDKNLQREPGVRLALDGVKSNHNGEGNHRSMCMSIWSSLYIGTSGPDKQ